MDNGLGAVSCDKKHCREFFVYTDTMSMISNSTVNLTKVEILLLDVRQ